MAKKVEVDIKLLIVAIALIIVASVGSAFTAYLILSENDLPFASASSNDNLKTDIGPTFDVGEFTVNLAGTSPSRFIRTGIVLEFDDKSVIKEADRRLPQLRDQIISIIRSYSAADLNTKKGDQQLKANITDSINDILISGEIIDVFFVDLVIQ